MAQGASISLPVWQPLAAGQRAYAYASTAVAAPTGSPVPGAAALAALFATTGAPMPVPTIEPPARTVAAPRAPLPGPVRPARRATHAAPAARTANRGIPSPHRSTLRVGPLTFHAYGLIMATAMATGGAIFLRNVRRGGIDSARASALILPTIAAGVVGARLYHVMSEPQHYRQHPIDALKLWNGGLGIYGGVALAAATGGVLARRSGLPVAKLLDAAAPGLLVAQAIGRLGNYANQELYGRPTKLPWGLQIDRAHRPQRYRNENSFHPTFLYEALWNLGVAGALVKVRSAWPQRAPGTLFALYLAGYSVGRFGVESLRADDSHSWGGLRQNQWTSLGILGAAGTGALLLNRR